MPRPSAPAELLLHSVAPIYGLRAASLRFFTVYGPRQRPDLAIHAFARRMVEGRTVTLFGDGTQSRDYTYCDDIVAGAVAAVDWTATRSGRGGHVQSRREPDRPDRRHGGGDRRALGIQPRIEWAPMQPGDVQRTAADLTKSQRGAGLHAAHAVPRGNSTVRRLVPGGIWPRRLTACSRGRRSDSRCRTTTARCTCWRRSSPAGARSRTCTTCSACRSRCWVKSERALGEFTRALELNPRYLEALIHQGVVLNELGRERGGRRVVPPGGGQRRGPVHRAARARGGPAGQPPFRAGHRVRRRRRDRARDRAVSARAGAGACVPRSALPDGAAPPRDRAGRWRQGGVGEACSRRGPTSWMRRRRSGLAHYLSGDAIGAREVWRRCLDRRPENAQGGGLSLDAGPNRRVRTAPARVPRTRYRVWAGADGERRADEAYAAGRYGEALAMYRELSGGVRSRACWPRSARRRSTRDGWAKRRTPTSSSPAKIRPAGVRRRQVSKGSCAPPNGAGKRAALQEAVLGLQTIAPDGVPGRYALVLAQQPDAEAEELVSLLPGAIAAADDQGSGGLAAVPLRPGAGGDGGVWPGAAPVSGGGSGGPRTRRSERGAGAHRGLRAGQGLKAQKAGRQEDAVLWFAEASRVDSSSVTGRRALVSLRRPSLCTRAIRSRAALAFQTAVSASVAGEIRSATSPEFDWPELGLVPNAGDTARPDTQ